MDYRFGATSFHKDPEDCFDEPSVSIQFSLRIAIFSSVDPVMKFVLIGSHLIGNIQI